MKISYDLHIHSKLSPCSSELMTPNNILNMCMLKGLNLVSVTDHNSSKQQEVIGKISTSYDYIYIYGIELSINEGYHILAYFESLDKIINFDNFIDNFLNKEKTKKLQEQIIYNIYDEEVDYIEYDLHQNIIIDLNELTNEIRKKNGIIILAHIDRQKSGIFNFDVDLMNLDFDGFEVDNINNLETIYQKYPFLKKYKILKNSDSHDLEMINEDQFIEIKNLSFEGLKAWFRDE